MKKIKYPNRLISFLLNIDNSQENQPIMKKTNQELKDNSSMHFFRLKLLIIIITFIGVNNVYSQKEINFNYKGHLIASPPTELKTEEDLKFIIYFDESFRGNHIAKILDHYFETYDGVQKLIDSKGGKLKLDVPKLKIVLKELVFEINSILKNFPKTSFKIWNTYNEKRLKKGIDPKQTPGVGYVFQYVPLHNEFLNKEFVIKVKEFDNENNLLQAPKKIPINLIDDNFNIANNALGVQGVQGVKSLEWNLPFEESDKTTHKIHKNCTRIIYELREINPYYNHINKLNFQTFNKEIKNEIKNLISSQKFKDAKQYINDYKDWKAKFVDNNGKLKSTELDNQIKAIDAHNNALNIINNNIKLEKSILETLWVTKGQPKLKPLNLDLEKKNLLEQKKELEKLNAQISEIDKFLTNDAFNLIDFGSIKTPYEDISTLRLKQKTLQKKVNSADKKFKQNQFYTRYDALHYQGELFISGTRKYVMHHHNAQNDYLIWFGSRMKEVPEDKNLLVLVENEKKSTKLEVDLAVTQIENDLSQLAEESQLSASAGDQLDKSKNEFADDPNKDKLIEFLTKYLELTNQINEIKGYSKALPIIFKIPKNENIVPNLISKLIPHEKPVTVPAKVEYTISQKTGSDLKELWKGEYRNNKLYRIRLKTGFVYSQFDKTDIAISEDSLGVVSVDTTQTRHGVDGTFGIQYYPWKRDIRKNGQWEPVLYLGFSMREPLKNLYTGIGVEPVSGLTLMGGIHLSQTEILKTREENIPVGTELKWKANNVFFSILVDIVFFKNLFGSKSLLD